MARLVSLNVGLPQDIAWHGKTVHTAVWKHAVEGRRRVRRLNVDGDRQGDLHGHGGEQRAVLVYQIESYRFWAREFGREDFVYGQFGENFTVEALADEEVCIGDRYRIGSAVFEVTQPRVTCYRVGIRMGEPRMAALLVAHHRPGFYLRVIEEGEVGAGDAIVKVADGPERLSVTEADALVYLEARHPDPRTLERALAIDAFSPGWKATLRAMAEKARGTGWEENPGIILESGAPAAWEGFRPLRVAAREWQSRDVLALELVSETRGAPAEPGQFITLHLPAGKAGEGVLRSYSLTDASRPGHYPVGIKCEAHGAAGRYVENGLQPGDTVEVAAPRGGFALRAGEQPVVLLSAGIGITPVLAMLRALAGARSRRPLSWIHCARNGARHPFAAEAKRLLARLPNARRLIVYSQPLAPDRQGVDYDLAGRLDLARLHEFGVARDADVYLCGPDSFMRDMQAALAAIPVPPVHIRTEVFGARDSATPGVVKEPNRAPHPPSGPAGGGPRVSFARSGVAANWDDRYGSLLEMAEACDINVRWACRTGVCHTCISRLLEGRVHYFTEPLDRPDEGNALICCARPVGEVAIDI